MTAKPVPSKEVIESRPVAAFWAGVNLRYYEGTEALELLHLHFGFPQPPTPLKASEIDYVLE